jgi:hypothetical protein
MKKTSVVIGVLLVASSCQAAGWFHRAYQGELVDKQEQMRFVVDPTGRIDIQTWGAYGGALYWDSSSKPPEPTWRTQLSVASQEKLEHLIQNLQQVDSDIKKANKEQK